MLGLRIPRSIWEMACFVTPSLSASCSWLKDLFFLSSLILLLYVLIATPRKKYKQIVYFSIDNYKLIVYIGKVNFEFTQRQQEGGEAMPDRTIIGERLKRLRGSRTLADVATALGVTEMAVSLWERGERMPSDDMKVKIANYYRRSVTTLFFRD